MFKKRNKPRGFIKLSKGIAHRLHPYLEILDKTKVPFEGWYHMQEKYFFVMYGVEMEKGMFTQRPEFIVDIIKEYEGDFHDVLC